MGVSAATIPLILGAGSVDTTQLAAGAVTLAKTNLSELRYYDNQTDATEYSETGTSFVLKKTFTITPTSTASILTVLRWEGQLKWVGGSGTTRSQVSIRVWDGSTESTLVAAEGGVDAGAVGFEMGGSQTAQADSDSSYVKRRVYTQFPQNMLTGQSSYEVRIYLRKVDATTAFLDEQDLTVEWITPAT